MKLSLKILAIVILAASTYSMIGCAAPSSFTYQNVTLSLVPYCADCGSGLVYSVATPTTLMVPTSGTEGSCIQFNAVVTNAPPTNVIWNIYPTSGLTDPTIASGGNPVGEGGSAVGSFDSGQQTATGPTVTYCTPGGYPIYSGKALLQTQSMQYTIAGQSQVGIPQGDILLSATVPTDPSNPAATITTYQLLQFYNGIHLSLTPANVSLLPNATYQFNGFGYAATPCLGSGCVIAPNVSTTFPLGLTYPTGSAINTVTWEVGAHAGGAVPVVGGNATYGTITQTGLYTAPATIPPTGVYVTIVANSNGTTASTSQVTIY
jgi:hypothetical protein